jgi:hypothetical protein
MSLTIFGFAPRIDLPGRVAVAKHVRTDSSVRDACGASIFSDLGSDCTGANAMVRKGNANEDRARLDVCGSSSLNVGCKRFRDSRQQWQLKRHIGLRSSCSQHIGAPIDVLETQTDHLARTKAVGSHKQKHGKVSTADRGVSWYDSKDAANRSPRQSAWWALIAAVAWRDHARR